MGFADQAGDYIEDISDALSRAGWLAWAVAAGWLICPFAVAHCFYPEDVLRLEYKLQGLRVPSGFTAQQLVVGEFWALAALGTLALLQLVLTALFYRKAQMDGAEAAAPVLWPLALIVAGVVGNAAWFFGTCAWDTAGCIIGLLPPALTVGAELICNKLGREFVYGSGAAAKVPALFAPAWPAAQSTWSAEPAGPVFYDIPE